VCTSCVKNPNINKSVPNQIKKVKNGIKITPHDPNTPSGSVEVEATVAAKPTLLPGPDKKPIDAPVNPNEKKKKNNQNASGNNYN